MMFIFLFRNTEEGPHPSEGAE